MTKDLKKQKALIYHKARDAYDTNGKTGTLLTKECNTAEELSLAYSPGVAYPCLEIQSDEQQAYTYTNKGNLVAVISDGTAVLGLGDIGHKASKPVMEGKCVLFKKFANVDAIDLQVSQKSVDELVTTIHAISDSFGGINLEDIGAPKCFEVEEKLKEICDIPVFHDDQHGTAVITTAGLINSLKMTGKKADAIKVVVIGSGAAGIACAKMYQNLGVKNIYMFDSKGLIHTKREDLAGFKKEFAIESDVRTLEEAMDGADMVLGLSKADVITKEMVKSMNSNPVIFACANPDPEILPSDAKEVRDDVIVGTGRSDFANQVNNVLGFPAIFRGALDVQASKITEGMKLAASYALAELAKKEVPTEVKRAHNREDMSFGVDYVIPSPFDKRVLEYVASAVAKCALEEGVARVEYFDYDDYRRYLRELIKNNS
jgi:malate dehydrogenase (oxaloacetate-decarboxylating)(NADP+)